MTAGTVRAAKGFSGDGRFVGAAAKPTVVVHKKSRSGAAAPAAQPLALKDEEMLEECQAVRGIGGLQNLYKPVEEIDANPAAAYLALAMSYTKWKRTRPEGSVFLPAELTMAGLVARHLNSSDTGDAANLMGVAPCNLLMVHLSNAASIIEIKDYRGPQGNDDRAEHVRRDMTAYVVKTLVQFCGCKDVAARFDTAVMAIDPQYTGTDIDGIRNHITTARNVSRFVAEYGCT